MRAFSFFGTSNYLCCTGYLMSSDITVFCSSSTCLSPLSNPCTFQQAMKASCLCSRELDTDRCAPIGVLRTQAALKHYIQNLPKFVFVALLEGLKKKQPPTDKNSKHKGCASQQLCFVATAVFRSTANIVASERLNYQDKLEPIIKSHLLFHDFTKQRLLV